MTKKMGKSSSFFIINIDIVCTLWYYINMEGGKANEKETKEKACKVDYQSNNSDSSTYTSP